MFDVMVYSEARGSYIVYRDNISKHDAKHMCQDLKKSGKKAQLVSHRAERHAEGEPEDFDNEDFAEIPKKKTSHRRENQREELPTI